MTKRSVNVIVLPMKNKLALFVALLASVLLVTPLFAKKPQVEVIQIKGPINPIIAQHTIDAIEMAEGKAAECLVIEIDTPGGLESSMRQIVQRILTASVPIAVYVSPSGSRAASAGAFIVLAGDIAAMAEGTTIGAAHPVEITGQKASDKITNDAAAFMRTIAEKKGRNIKLAEDIVIESSSLTEKEALEKRIIDLIATDRDDLLTKIDGKKIEKGLKTFELKTKDAEVVFRELNPLKRLLHSVTDPNIVYILLIIGFYGIVFELSHPGTFVSGIVGVICLILAFYGLGSLPVNYAGLFLIIFGVLLFILDIKAPTHGFLTLGGIIALTLGSFVLFKSGELFIKLSRALVATMVISTTGLLGFILPFILKAQKRKVSSGTESLIDEIGEAKTDLEPKGIVHVSGEDWYAEAQGGNIKSAEKVKVISVDGLILKVKKAR